MAGGNAMAGAIREVNRTGPEWGPPRRRDAESGPPARGTGGRFAASGARPPYAGGGDRRDDRRSGPPPRSADGKFQSRGFPDRRFEGKPAGRPYPPSDRPGGGDRERPARPPREGDDEATTGFRAAEKRFTAQWSAAWRFVSQRASAKRTAAQWTTAQRTTKKRSLLWTAPERASPWSR